MKNDKQRRTENARPALSVLWLPRVRILRRAHGIREPLYSERLRKKPALPLPYLRAASACSRRLGKAAGSWAQ